MGTIDGALGRALEPELRRGPRRQRWLGIASVIESVAALVVAGLIWLPVLVALASPLWRAGPTGASFVLLAIGLLAFPEIAALPDRFPAARPRPLR